MTAGIFRSFHRFQNIPALQNPLACKNHLTCSHEAADQDLITVRLVMELAELKGNGQMELYRQQSQAVLKQLKKDYKRQTKN